MADGKLSKSKSSGKSESIVPSSVRAAVEAIAKGIGVAATELWTIFVRQYIVRGLSEAFTAVVLGTTAFFLREAIGYWAFIPASVAMLFAYGAIAYLGNPKYYALADITKRIQDFKDDNDKGSSKSSDKWC